MAKFITVPRAAWTTFFDGVSQTLLGARAEIEVASLDLGDQIAVEWIPMLGITYESRDDLIDVALGGWNHLMRQPREVVVEQLPAGLTSIAIVDANGARQIVKLKAPVMLPPGDAALPVADK